MTAEQELQQLIYFLQLRIIRGDKYKHMKKNVLDKSKQSRGIFE
jgi:hypothetical protein